MRAKIRALLLAKVTAKRRGLFLPQRRAMHRALDVDQSLRHQRVIISTKARRAARGRSIMQIPLPGTALFLFILHCSALFVL